MILYIPMTTPETTTKTVDYGIPNLALRTIEAQPAQPARYRERDYGVGYGSSSGYASQRRYANHSAQSYFRCS
jgi:hypothetical protein